MTIRTRALAALAFTLAAAPAFGASLPEIRSTDGNPVQACATPGRLMAFLNARNAKAGERFSGIATEYMRHGEDLNIRWDIAFYQMMLETGSLTFTGDVDIKQNNFAGLGATGRKAPGESFKSVSDGVRAHLQHVLMYSGEKIENPVAERTRKVQEWDVLGPWQKAIKGPITFAQLAKQWAPTSSNYSAEIADLADQFNTGYCAKPDPNPELVAEARKNKTIANIEKKTSQKPSAGVAKAEANSEAAVSGKDLAKRAIDDARTSGETSRLGLGAAELSQAATAAKPDAITTGATPAPPAVTIINAAKIEEPATADTATAPSVAETTAPQAPANVQLAAAATAAAPAAAKVNPASKCNVLTASYGGQKSIIIKAKAEGVDSYTVLDVNEGAEKREADAYITAYAKGGETVGEFANQNAALDKAFELCPEG